MADQYILEMKNITKLFPGVRALDNVDFCVKSGEVRALVGENGAGKSTLIKILTGVYKATSGSITLMNQKIDNPDSATIKRMGLSCIYQDQNFVPYFSIAESLFMDDLPQKNYGLIDQKKLFEKAEALLKRLNINLEPHLLMGDLTVSEQQLIQIAAAVHGKASIMLLDEPTAPLSSDEVERLFQIINDLKKDGVTIIYISHRLEEIFRIADTVSVLRNGKMIDTLNIKETNQDEIIKLMVGKDVEEKYPKTKVKIGEEIFRIDNYTSDKVKNVSFDLRKGEVFGIYGVVGAGKTELAKLIFGADKKEDGRLYIDGQECVIESPNAAIKKGIAFVSEDRRKEGLVGDFSICRNITLASLWKYIKRIFINFKRERTVSQTYVGELNIKTPTIETLVRTLSGGNQQKVILSKWLSSDAKIFILDQPTIGVDVGAKTEIYRLIGTLVSNGAGVIFISSEIPEIINLTDRVGVMKHGEMVKILDTKETDPQKLLAYALKGGEL
ncbi:MAG TPA: sugar ABC transporter ATP-binding protein [Firmicutes bacterium]|jgi:ribose transport system ATP-binding protein|nr:sugar ABC transporter ATP-binding protein [Bacillota bacterium]